MIQVFENHSQWTTVKDVCQQLHQAGFAALLAGGCVRDLLLNRIPHDFDIATDARPEQVEALFPRAMTVGREFGVTMLPYDGFQLEVATFREDGNYLDGRRPESVIFSGSEADAKRRDFTMNALFYDLDRGEILDFVGGQADIMRHLIQTVGEPGQRFTEDKLRLLRAVRFSAQLGFAIEEKTLAAISKLAPTITAVSRERVRDELGKLLLSDDPVRGIELGFQTGLFEHLFPEMASAVEAFPKATWLADFRRLSKIELSSALKVELRLALFFLPQYLENEKKEGSVKAEKRVREHTLKNLKLENRVIESILYAYRHLNEYLEPTKVRRGQFAFRLLHPASGIAEDLAELVIAAKESGLADQKRQAWMESIKASLRNDAGVLVKPTPWLDGAELKKQGYAPGPKIGRLLEESFLLQLEGSISSLEQALTWLKTQARDPS
jgi:poly(A) polymerase